jgi:hypothetical protein
MDVLNMNKQQKIRQLARKYFWQQKIEEVSEFLKSISLYSLIASLIMGGSIFLSNLSEDNLKTLLEYLSILALIVAGILLLVEFFIWFIDWIGTNKEEALARARKEVYGK